MIIENLSEIAGKLSSAGDNHKVELMSEGRVALELGMALAFSFAPGKAEYFLIDSEGLTLFWNEPGGGLKASALPYHMDLLSAIDFAWNWLIAANYGNQPDHDGSNGKGFVLTTGDYWGHIDGNHYSICRVFPCWSMYGK